MKSLYLFLFLITMLNTNSNAQKKRAIDRFRKIIVGDFDNRKQVEEEKKAGKQIHPLAKHVNRIADEKIIDAPARDGFWILEESYYEYPNKPVDSKPYLFFFEAVGDTAVRLIVYKVPASITVSELKNNNQNLKLKFSELTTSPTFKPSIYTAHGKSFKCNAKNDLGNGMTFTLIETLSPKQLNVMELLEKNGKSLVPYDTPIIYDRL
jgi:hypothetical protein